MACASRRLPEGVRMRRRDFMALLGSAAATWPLAAHGQQAAKIPRIGILDDAPMWQAFRQALRELGYVEGQNIAYEYRYGDGAPNRLATAAAELVRRPVDLIATYGTPATHAAKEATATIPIVMIGVGDPVGAGVALIPVEVRSVGDFDPALAAMLRERPDALLVSNDAFHQLHIGRIIEFLAENRLPGMFQAKENVAAGGFMAYGASLPDLFRRAASYVHRILQGTKPGDLPVESPAKFDLAVNLKTATALGIDIPPTLLARADEVIE